MKPNPNKFQFMIFGKSTRQSIILNINKIKIRKSYFTIKEMPYCLRNKNFFENTINIPSTCFTRYGTNSMLFRACFHVLCGISYLFLLNKGNHSFILNQKLKNAPAKFAVYNFMIKCG